MGPGSAEPRQTGGKQSIQQRPCFQVPQQLTTSANRKDGQNYQDPHYNDYYFSLMVIPYLLPFLGPVQWLMGPFWPQHSVPSLPICRLFILKCRLAAATMSQQPKKAQSSTLTASRGRIKKAHINVRRPLKYKDSRRQLQVGMVHNESD